MAARSLSPPARSFQIEHHRDAAREADDDDAGAVRGLVGEEQPGEREHERRRDDPREEQRDAEHAAVAAHLAHVLVADLRQDRVHHQQQPERDRQADRADLELVEEVVEPGTSDPSARPPAIAERDPQRQEPVERRQAAEHGGLGWMGRGGVHVLSTGHYMDDTQWNGRDGEPSACLRDLRVIPSESPHGGPRSNEQCATLVMTR